MRLIDGDKLYKTLAKPSDIPGDTIDVMEVRLAILAAPEVEAIPIEWIENYVRNKFCLADWYGGFIHGINMMLDDWEKENETN